MSNDNTARKRPSQNSRSNNSKTYSNREHKHTDRSPTESFRETKRHRTDDYVGRSKKTDKHERSYSTKSHSHWDGPEADTREDRRHIRCAEASAEQSSSERMASPGVRWRKQTENEIDRESREVGDTDEKKKASELNDDVDIDWEAYRSVLDGIFFREVDVIKRNSQEYHDFWMFFKKYQDFQRRNPHRRSKMLTEEDLQNTSRSGQLGIPSVYNKRHRINISLGCKNLESVLQKQSKYCHSGMPELTKTQLNYVQLVLLHYSDFQQKQKFAKLKKIKKDQQSLPIHQYKAEVLEAVAQNQVVVVAGDTGCGKSTQVPQYLLEAGYENIACTQPRRIACISLSKRVSFETLNEYGSEVAFQVRFEKSRTKATKILFLTEGLLLRQIEIDPSLKQYNVILIDEVHERHIHTDFLLGVIKCILHQRSDLKLVLMSATINIELFSGYFDNAPVCKVPGRLYPIQLQYIPKDASEVAEKKDRLDPSPYMRILQLIDHKYPPTERGDVLIFLSGMSDIMAVVEAAKEYAQKVKSWIVLPLHSALSIAEQDKVFDYAPEGIRKCVVSTNIAETSVTIDGIRFVVDSGKVKEMNYDTKFGMQKLQEFWISRASAEQRKGRAGRTGPGVCYRLYSESDYDAFQEYSTPEIQRVPLDSLLLQLISMGLPDARRFPFIEPPPKASIETSIAFLKEQSALDEKEQLTPIGELLAQLPVDVIVGKMLIMASVFDMIDPVLTIAAGLCIQSVFTSRAHRDYDASQLRKSFESDHGDPLTLLNAFDSWVKVKAEGGDSRKWCRRRGLEEQRFYEMTKLKQQFRELLIDHGLLNREATDTYTDPEDRRKKVIDRRKLGELRHEQRKTSRKRKVLKMEDDDWNIEHSDESDEKPEDPTEDLDGNIKDLEFRLKNDMTALHEKANASRNLTQKELIMLKVILCSGLYPQIAIADEHNTFKAETDQVFHTKKKGFVLLHPTSVFTLNPDVLQLKDHEIKEVPGKPSNRGHLSNKHQLLAFLTLLETTKPYLMGSMRVPALQTVLLFSNSLDTNQDFRRIACDGWLEIKFEDGEDAEAIIDAVIKLRTTWHHLLKQKLELCGRNPGADKVLQRRKLRHTQATLSTKLTEFLHTDIHYYIRRIHAVEIQTLYRGPSMVVEDSRSQNFLRDLVNLGGDPHPYKGGLQVTPYLVYDCLQEDELVWGEFTQCMQRHWTCPECNRAMIVTVAERLRHQQDCQKEQLVGDAEKAIRNAEEKVKMDALDRTRKSYHCPTCKKDFRFTTVEIFKHKKDCVSESS